MRQVWFLLCLCMGGGCFLAERLPLSFAAPVLILTAFALFLWRKKIDALYPLVALFVFVLAASSLHGPEYVKIR